MDKTGKFFKILDFFENMVMTNHSCVCCGREIADGTKFQLCETCKEYIMPITGKLCEKCGETVSNEVLVCERCKVSSFAFETNRSFVHYDESSSAIVKGLKYGHKKYFAENVAEMICSMSDYFESVEILTFVPISNSRRKQRGFNQAEEIAKGIGKLLNIEVVETLSKVTDGKNQAKLSQAERLKNLLGSFAVKPEAKDKIKNKVVMIVDDVFTTGATLNECAKTLKTLKPKQIKTVTFAKTKFNLSK